MKTSRGKSRELALKGLYEWQLSGNAIDAIAEPLRERLAGADENYFFALFRGAVEHAEQSERLISPHLDRSFKSLSPIERGILLIAAYELNRQPEVPYRVVINEAVELAKSYGGTDGYKYVNGVLDKLAGELRPGDVEGRHR